MLNQIIGKLVIGTVQLAVNIISPVAHFVECATSPKERRHQETIIIIMVLMKVKEIRTGSKVIGIVLIVATTNLQVECNVDNVVLRDQMAAEDGAAAEAVAEVWVLLA